MTCSLGKHGASPGFLDIQKTATYMGIVKGAEPAVSDGSVRY